LQISENIGPKLQLSLYYSMQQIAVR